ncbi:hypothetical protein J1N35_021933 [Gossypium stocksii]|uniref:Uncharacterized protein n=1 Tax=Gossypium stocksii TaxID=47602 RepID=A0A9D3VGN0_9ROSI|nr:hypothetical protein J1N35_021933 [Gossypium stocksii]
MAHLNENFPINLFAGQPGASGAKRRDLRAHIMQYNDYMNVLGASDAGKCKALLKTLKSSASPSTRFRP